MKLLFIDLETTGFSRQWDYIIEIAAVLYDVEGRQEMYRFHEYIKPGKTIPAKITKITGITNSQVAGCRAEDDVMRDFVEFVAIAKPDAIVWHNGDVFDGQFIQEKSDKYFLDFDLSKYTTIDTLKMARKIKPPVGMSTATGKPSYKQTSLAMGMGLDYKAHSAIDDTLALAEIYFWLLGIVTNREDSKRNKLGF